MHDVAAAFPSVYYDFGGGNIFHQPEGQAPAGLPFTLGGIKGNAFAAPRKFLRLQFFSKADNLINRITVVPG
jgi:hypothetical protein